MNKKRKIKYAVFIFCWFVAVIIFAANIAFTQNLFLYNTFNSIFGGERRKLVSGDPAAEEYQYYKADYADKASTLAAANSLNERIEEEGIILLKNEDSLPLAKKSKISVFGKNSANLVYGGSGSGGSSSKGAVTLEQSLTSAGFEINPVLKAFYDNGSASGGGRPSKGPSMGDTPAGIPTYETPWASYTSSVTDSFSNYNDAALIVISRIGGEGFDLPRTMKTNYTAKATAVEGARSADDHYLQLDANEAELIRQVGERFSNVILIINSSAPMELGFLDDPSHYAYSSNLKGALWIGNPGLTGINALGRVLNGDVNPSGRTVDTFARDFKQDPTWFNFGNNNADNGNRYTVGGKNQTYYYVDYEEGIYVGYRYWETRGVTDGEEWYKNHVVYPMGYGLSYAEFGWEIVDKPESAVVLNGDTQITVKVKVTNVSQTEVSGKDVVEVYYEAPYTAGGIEKSSVVLAGFAKTKLLQKGESDTVEISFNAYDMASYDYNDANESGHKGYELDEGDYKIKISKNAHETVDEITYNLSERVEYDTDLEGREVKNRFDDVSGGTDGSIKYLSRDGWKNFPEAPTAEDREVSKTFIDSLKYDNNDEGKKWYTDEMPEQSKNKLSYSKSEVKLYQLIGKDYDDPLWDKLLNQLTVNEMVQLIGAGNYHTVAMENISKPRTIDADGPVGFTPFMGDPSIYDTCFYASGCVIAATYNEELAFEMGKMVGNEGLIGNESGDGTPYSGWYAPGVNLHRSPFGGRNWEYYSEDGLLSGKIASSVIRGAMSKGVYAFVKHFALNEQETNRTSNGYLTWASEQSMRELYLKPFELSVKEGGTTAVMSSFNRIGKVWAGGSYELLTEVLREEWGFRGTVITDYNLYVHMPADQMIKAGGDLVLSQEKSPSSTATATQVTALRNATHNILYTVANSNAMNGLGEGVIYKYAIPVWEILFIVADVLAMCAMCVWTGFFVYGEIKYRKNAGSASESVEAEEGNLEINGADEGVETEDGNVETSGTDEGGQNGEQTPEQ